MKKIGLCFTCREADLETLATIIDVRNLVAFSTMSTVLWTGLFRQ